MRANNSCHSLYCRLLPTPLCPQQVLPAPVELCAVSAWELGWVQQLRLQLTGVQAVKADRLAARLGQLPFLLHSPKPESADM